MEINKETEEEEMRRLIQELITCYRSLGNDLDNPEIPDSNAATPVMEEEYSPVSDRAQIHPSAESVRAKNELLMLLVGSNLPNFTQSETFRDGTISKKYPPTEKE